MKFEKSLNGVIDIAEKAIDIAEKAADAFADVAGNDKSAQVAATSLHICIELARIGADYAELDNLPRTEFIERICGLIYVYQHTNGLTHDDMTQLLTDIVVTTVAADAPQNTH